jgi:hypothetical protein
MRLIGHLAAERVEGLGVTVASGGSTKTEPGTAEHELCAEADWVSLVAWAHRL